MRSRELLVFEIMHTPECLDSGLDSRIYGGPGTFLSNCTNYGTRVPATSEHKLSEPRKPHPIISFPLARIMGRESQRPVHQNCASRESLTQPPPIISAQTVQIMGPSFQRVSAPSAPWRPGGQFLRKSRVAWLARE